MAFRGQKLGIFQAKESLTHTRSGVYRLVYVVVIAYRISSLSGTGIGCDVHTEIQEAAPCHMGRPDYAITQSPRMYAAK
jgi:hypothetical protein